MCPGYASNVALNKPVKHEIPTISLSTVIDWNENLWRVKQGVNSLVNNQSIGRKKTKITAVAVGTCMFTTRPTIY